MKFITYEVVLSVAEFELGCSSYGSVDLAVLGSAATIGDLKRHISNSMGCPAAGTISGPGLLHVDSYVGLCLTERKCLDKFYLLAGQLYMHQTEERRLSPSTALAPLAELSSCLAETVLRASAVTRPAAACRGMPGFRIAFKTPRCKIKCFNVHSDTTVEELRLMVEESEDIPPDQQRLIFSGRQLEDGRTMSDYGLDKAARLTAEGPGDMPFLDLAVRLRGGMYHATSGRHDNKNVSRRPLTHTEVTVVVPGRGELQLTVPIDVSGADLLQLVQQQAGAISN